MTATPETRYKCDRCGDELHVPATTNPPLHERQAGPEGWLALKLGTDPGVALEHLCPPCAWGLKAYLSDVTISITSSRLQSLSDGRVDAHGETAQ